MWNIGTLDVLTVNVWSDWEHESGEISVGSSWWMEFLYYEAVETLR